MDFSKEGERWRCLVFIAITGIVCCSHAAHAQEIPFKSVRADSVTALLKPGAEACAPEEYVPEWYSMFTNIPNDWVRYSRLTFTAEKIPAMVGMTLVTSALVATDDETWRLSDRWYKGSPATKRLSDLFEYMGDGRPQFGLAGAFAAFGLLAKDARAVRTASQTVEAILACGTVIQVLKHVTGRESPFVSTRPGGRWDVFPNQIEYHKHVPKYDAFPSGHIATALATVTVVAENYPEWWWTRPLGYTIVGLIGISMGNTGIHWYSDYPLGLALGYSFGMLAAHPPEMGGVEGESVVGVPKVSVLPFLTSSQAGVQVVVAF